MAGVGFVVGSTSADDFRKSMTCESFEMSESMKRRLLAQPLNPLRKMRVTVMSRFAHPSDSSVESNSPEPARASGPNADSNVE